VQFGPATYGLGFLAGSLSILSPCVLPLVPVLIATAAAAHRLGPLALAAGLACSFAAVGLAVAAFSSVLGLDADAIRVGGALLMIGFGLVLLLPAWQARFAGSLGGVGAAGGRLLSHLQVEGLAGQWLVGLVLGLVWSPCVGPTLGAATTLAERGQHLGEIALLLLVFGVGAGTPLVLLGRLSHTTLLRVRGRLVGAGQLGRALFGVSLAAFGVLIVSGLDRRLEGWLVQHSPDWLTALTTRF
jgi:cytochrome c biogenesis protein CcdA